MADLGHFDSRSTETLRLLFVFSIILFTSLLLETRQSPQITSAFQVLKEMVEDWLAHSAYSIINLSKLFRFFAVDPKAVDRLKTEDVELDILPENEHIDALMEMGTY